jgi:hypothetical protein
MTALLCLGDTTMSYRTSILGLTLLYGTVTGAAAEVTVPQAIRPPAGSVLKLQMQALGDQIYQCTLDAGQYRWQLKAPDAVLFDAQGRETGRHFAGPSWRHRDGSGIVGKVLHKLDVAPQTSIPWLLLEAIDNKGAGTFAGICYVNRVATQGGLPPETKCDGNHLGTEKRIPYRASYYFYAADTTLKCGVYQ